MSFADAIRSVLSQYATFSGRARRSEYWFWTLAVFIATTITTTIDRGLGTDSGQTGIVTTVVILALFLPGLAVAFRRLHDTGRSAGWIFIGLIPVVGAIVLLVFLVGDSQGDNQYGPSPKAVGQGGYAGTKVLR